MARRGDVIVNPATGERIVFLETAGDTGGQLLRLDLTMPPGVAVPAAHIHPSQEERFELVTGSVRFRAGRKTFTARAGEAVVVPPGTPHRFWNDGGEELSGSSSSSSSCGAGS
jgi:mannose-6-phosphate isomerase-like protein (cupin superfamily)